MNQRSAWRVSIALAAAGLVAACGGMSGYGEPGVGNDETTQRQIYEGSRMKGMAGNQTIVRRGLVGVSEGSLSPAEQAERDAQGYCMQRNNQGVVVVDKRERRYQDRGATWSEALIEFRCAVSIH